MSLTLEGVSVRRGRRTVVEGASFEVAAGEVVALLGPNGAGKSTLLQAIGGILPSSGTIRREGRVATVLQTPGLARRSVRANVDLAQAWWGVPRRQRRSRSLEALRALGAERLARRQALGLSGGEQRRVHLARGVAVRPDLLLLDEPFAGLDPETHSALVEDTATVLRSPERSVLVVLHDRSDAWALADRIVVLMEEPIVATGTPEALLAAPPTAEVARFLGFDGELADSGGVLLTRSALVRIAPDGDLPATVTRVVRLQDGARVELSAERGTLRALHPDASIAVGDAVRAAVSGGVRFRGDGALDAPSGP